jgi:hypothetical protein
MPAFWYRLVMTATRAAVSAAFVERLTKLEQQRQK